METHEHESRSQEEIVAEARRAFKQGQVAEWKEGKCSSCGQTVDRGNFCNLCSATFLTEEQIDRGETIH